MRPTVHTQCSAPDSEPATIYLRDYCAPPSLHHILTCILHRTAEMNPAAAVDDGGPFSDEVITYGTITFTFEHELDMCDPIFDARSTHSTAKDKVTRGSSSSNGPTAAAATPPCPAAEKSGTPDKSAPVAVCAPKSRTAGARKKEGKGRSCHQCSNICSFTLLLAILLVTTAYFVLHCTPLLDELVDEPNARAWLGVTLPIEIVCWMVLPVAVLNNIVVIVRTTCCWAQTTKDAARIKIHKDKKGLMQLYSWAIYVKSNRHPYYFW